MTTKTLLKNYIKDYQKPILIYSLTQIKNRMLFLTKICQNSPIKMLFTIKSFPYQEIIDLAYQIMHGFEISNLNEYRLLPRETKNIVLSINDPTGRLNNKIPTKILEQNSCYLNFDVINEEQILSFKFQPNLTYGVRISHTSLLDCTNSYVPESRFGNSIDQIKQYKHLFVSKKISGIHLHNGSEENSLDSYLGMIDRICYHMEKASIPISFINLGGGLHKLTEPELKTLIEQLTPYFIKYNIQGFFEPGQCISKQAGYALGKIVTIKQFSQNQYYLVLDLSNECYLKWSEPIMLQEFIVQPNSINQQPLERSSTDNQKQLTVFIGGPTCFEHDCLGKFKVNPIDGKLPFKLNDILVFANINGYSAAWNMSFNGIEQASVIFI